MHVFVSSAIAYQTFSKSIANNASTHMQLSLLPQLHLPRPPNPQLCRNDGPLLAFSPEQFLTGHQQILKYLKNFAQHAFPLQFTD